MRVEWCQSRAHLDRWEEEIIRTRTEMEMAVRFFDWQQHWWLQKADAHPTAPSDIRSGLNAYARRQVAIRCEIATSWVTLWQPVLSRLRFADPWLTDKHQPCATSTPHDTRLTLGTLPVIEPESDGSGSDSDDENEGLVYGSEDDDY